LNFAKNKHFYAQIGFILRGLEYGTCLPTKAGKEHGSSSRFGFIEVLRHGVASRFFRDECHANIANLRIRRINPPLHHVSKPKTETAIKTAQIIAKLLTINELYILLTVFQQFSLWLFCHAERSESI
jgi:hypothetical protein